MLEFLRNKLFGVQEPCICRLFHTKVTETKQIMRVKFTYSGTSGFLREKTVDYDYDEANLCSIQKKIEKVKLEIRKLKYLVGFIRTDTIILTRITTSLEPITQVKYL